MGNPTDSTGWQAAVFNAWLLGDNNRLEELTEMGNDTPLIIALREAAKEQAGINEYFGESIPYGQGYRYHVECAVQQGLVQPLATVPAYEIGRDETNECPHGISYDEQCQDCEEEEEGRMLDDMNEPDHDDSVKCCPDCERPNQFGELCVECARERGEQPYN